MSAEPVIEVAGLQVRYGDVEAVREIDLDVHRGEIVAVLGPNGAGKTSTLEVLEGFRRRSGGVVRVLGVDPAHADASWRARIGVVLQSSEPERHLTVVQCLALYAGYYPSPLPVAETLALVGLADQAAMRASRLSGGQQRRLDVALALVGDPELVFLDEPTSGFDPSARRAAWDVIRRLRTLGKTVVLTTHQMEEAEFLADRIVVLVSGRVVAAGPPETLAGRNRGPTVITFTLDRPGATELPAGMHERAQRRGRQVRISTTDALEDLCALRDWTRECGYSIDDLTVAGKSLEEAYLDLTRGAR